MMIQNQLLTKRQFLFLYLGFGLVYILGMFIPLMENDSAQHASMAMRMVNNHDFVSLYKGDNPYLDKPHLHFWLAALSMKTFGVSHFAYRIPAVLCLFLGAFSTFKIADILYQNNNLSYIASLVFLSSQTIILSAHDVRTDAVLTGFIALAIWQVLTFIKTQKILAVLFGGLAMALAFSCKGLMAVVIIGFPVFSYLLYSRQWRRFFNLKVLFGLLSFGIGILPILYAYYQQFGTNGVEFILIRQSFDRLNANGFEENSPDYLFFFHTLLWVFLPFSLVFYFGVFERTKFFIQQRFRKINGVEFLTLGGFWLVMLLFSFSKFKLPHYLNGLICVLSLFTAFYIFYLNQKEKKKTIKVLYIVQLVVVFASIFGIGLLTYYFSRIPDFMFYGVFIVLIFILLYVVFRKRDIFQKFILVSLLFAISVNVYLNSQFYPVLTQYQGGLKMAEYVHENKMNPEEIYMEKGSEIWSFDFYTKRNTPRKAIEELKVKDKLIIHESDLGNVKRKYKILHTENHFRITRLSLKFLNPEKRPEQLSKMLLLEIEE